MVGIYKITSPSKKVYIGQSTNIKYRFYRYSILDCKQQKKLYNSIKEYAEINNLKRINVLRALKGITKNKKFNNLKII